MIATTPPPQLLLPLMLMGLVPFLLLFLLLALLLAVSLVAHWRVWLALGVVGPAIWWMFTYHQPQPKSTVEQLEKQQSSLNARVSDLEEKLNP